MSRLDDAAEIIALAEDLGLGQPARPVQAIIDMCQRNVEGWVREARGVTTPADLEAVVASRLQMTFEEIWSDNDFDRIKAKYAAKKDFVFATLRQAFGGEDTPVYGALVRRKHVGTDDPDRYVAVIDCRGAKALRRFYTRWHEVAHRMTTDADPDRPEFRSEDDPIERLMDEVAGHLAFFGPLFDPAFRAAHGGGLLSFATVEAVWRGAFPDASFQATLCACTRKLSTPVIYLEAAMGHKAAVRKEIEDDSPRLFAFEEPPAELRAVRMVANEPALNEDFVIHRNMRVPTTSTIHRLFLDQTGRDASEREDMSMWESGGKRLGARAVAVEARRFGDRVIAIVQPVEPVRPRRQTRPTKSEGRTMFDV